MRKILIGLLLAGAAATPAIAGPHDGSDRQQAREDRQSAHQAAHEERVQARTESRAQSNDGNRPQFTRSNGGAAPQVEMRQQAFTNGGGGFVRPDRGNFASRPEAGGATTYVAPGPRVVNAPRSQFGNGRMDNRNALRDQRVQERELRQSDRVQPNLIRDRHPLVVSNTPRPGTEPPLRTEGRRGGDVHWNRDWRNDHRYDWRDRRRHHPSLFHFGFFIDPFGWGYQPFDIGYRLWPAYYSSQYLIDPGLYGLPYPPPGAVWIRYWNDVILVDTYTGTVLDVIPNFFW